MWAPPCRLAPETATALGFEAACGLLAPLLSRWNDREEAGGGKRPGARALRLRHHGA